MATWQDRTDPPWHGVDSRTMRALEIHEARVHAGAPGREFIDLADAIAVFDPSDRDPFFNRVGAIRWPDDPAAFDRRLDEIKAIFAGRDRRPYFWMAAGYNTPADLAARLSARGFIDLGGGLTMLLVRRPLPAAGPPPPGVDLERIAGRTSGGYQAASLAAAGVISSAFDLDPGRLPSLQRELGAGLDRGTVQLRLVRFEGEAVAVGRRDSFDGISYLSAIGTRPDWQGRGFGEIVTTALVRDALADGDELVHLGVHVHNRRAQDLYRRVGFAMLGDRAEDYLLP